MGAGDFHSDRTFDAGGKHVDTVANRRYPDIGQPWNPNHAIQFFHQFFLGHAWTPLLVWLELNGGFEHFQWCRVGGSFGTPRFAEHVLDFGHRLDQAVGLLQQLRSFLCRQPRESGRHIEQITFVQRREKLTAQARHWP
ncbi:hypothetical protein D3C84_737050 [compost metagenome]